MPAKKRVREPISESKPPPTPHEKQLFLDSGDDMLRVGETITVSNWLRSIKPSTYTPMDHAGEESFQWDLLIAAFKGRTVTSPRWFLQARAEDLLLEPDGTDGRRVPCVIALETLQPTISPRYYTLPTRLPDMDEEDHIPSQVFEMDGYVWKPCVQDDGTSMNVFVLCPTQTSTPSFGFGGGVTSGTDTNESTAPQTGPMPPSFGTTGTPSTTGAPPHGFGLNPTMPSFGSGSNPTPPTTGAPSFGFGTNPTPATTAAAVPPSFAFGGASPPATPGPSEAAVPPRTFGATPAEAPTMALWSEAAVKQSLKALRGGRRIRIRVNLPGREDALHVTMEDDTKGTPNAAADQWVRKRFAKLDKVVGSFASWVERCPVYEDRLAAELQRAHGAVVRRRIKEAADEFTEMYNALHPAVSVALTAACARRAPIRARQEAILETIRSRIAEGTMASREAFRIMKFYPHNDRLKFRPFAKVVGLTGGGEEAECFPPAWRFHNKLLTGETS